MGVPPYESRQQWSESGRGGRFLESLMSVRLSLQESAMADVAFVVVTLAVFALVALAVKGVTKL